MKRIVLLLLTLLVLQVAHCQDPHIYSLITMPVSNDTVSVDEMKEAFFSSLKEINENLLSS